MTAIDVDELWSDSVSGRLREARALSESQLADLLARLSADRPCAYWPYGYSTSINPLVVTLGVSPGSARSRAGQEDPAKQLVSPPTAGKRHPHTTYSKSPTEFWRRIRHLARTTLQIGDITEEDAYALFGNVVLDPNRSGEARDAKIKPELGMWVLQTVRDHLRPRYLICLGMKGKKEAAKLLEATFDGFMRKEPHSEHLFRGYKCRQMTFEEWNVKGPCGNKIKIVYWPQHPRRVPFNSFDIWQAACQEFAHRHGRLIRP